MPVPPSIINKGLLNAPKNYTLNAFKNLPGNKATTPAKVSSNAVINSFTNRPSIGLKSAFVPVRPILGNPTTAIYKNLPTVPTAKNTPVAKTVNIENLLELPTAIDTSSNHPTNNLPELPTAIDTSSNHPTNNLPELPTLMQPTTGFGSLFQVLEKRNAQGIVIIPPPVIVVDALLEENGITYILQENGGYILY